MIEALGDRDSSFQGAKEIGALDQCRGHLQRIEEELKRVLDSQVPLIEDIGNHAVLSTGKRLRPLLFVLSSELCGYKGKDIYFLSTIFEVIHAASLLHDDVLDNAKIRRNKASANHVWGNHASVLEGDFLCSKALSIAVTTRNIKFLERLTEATVRMTEGQVMELVHVGDWRTTDEEYIGIITAKTAVLISAACACGGIIAGAGEETVHTLGEFGLNMGIAFQLMDDILDYASSEKILGKAAGKDLREGKVTLPLIYMLAELEEPERKRFETLLRNVGTYQKDHQKVVGMVQKGGVLDRIRKEAQDYVDYAGSYLTPFPDSPAKQNLLKLNGYVVQRKY